MNTALCGERGEGEGRERGRRGKRKGEEEEVRGGRKKKNTLKCHYKHSNHLATGYNSYYGTLCNLIKIQMWMA